jgi:ribosomal protein L37AE/L43A
MADAYGAERAAQDAEPRCHRCARMLARLLTRPWIIDCPRCGARNAQGATQAQLDAVAAARRAHPANTRGRRLVSVST